MKRFTLLTMMLFAFAFTNAWAEEARIVFSEEGLSDVFQYTEQFAMDANVIIIFGGGANDGTYNEADSAMCTYGGGTITIACANGVITEACFTWSGDPYQPSADVANPSGYDSSTSTWTGNASTVQLTRPAGSGHWRLKSVVVTYTITGEGGDDPDDPDDPDEPDEPAELVTCAEAVAICQETGETSTTEMYTIRGYVTAMVSAYSYQYDNVSFWMADEADGGKVLRAYRAMPVSDADITVKVGDYVEVTGTLVHKAGETPEVNQGASYYIVTPGEGDGDLGLPDPAKVLTCAEAVAVCELVSTNTTTDEYTVRGYVTEIKTAYSSHYRNISFWIADEAGGENMLLAYRVKPVASADITVKVGDYVEVKGSLVHYNGYTPEFNTGKYSILTPGEGGETPDIDLPDPAKVLTCAEALAICEMVGTNTTIDEYTVRGYVTEIKSAYSSQYRNIDFWIADEAGGENMLLAYRVKPVANADVTVEVGDYVEVKGCLVNYYGNTPEVNMGRYSIVTPGEGGGETPEPELPDPADVLTCAEALAICELVGTDATTDEYTVRGYVTEIKTAYSSQYRNIDFWIADEAGGENMLLAYRVKPETNADVAVEVGDYVEVKGSLLNYFGNTPEVNTGMYRIVTPGEGGGETPEPELPDPADVLTCAEALAICEMVGTDATTDEYTVRGYVTEIKSVYSSQYKNIDFWMADAAGGENMLLAYRVKPEADADIAVKVGDYVEVKGSLLNYYGNTPEVNTGMYRIVTPGEGGGETPDTPDVSDGAIVFDADVDRGNASTDFNNATAYQITKNGVTMDVTSGIIGTYNNEDHYRIYKNQTLTITSTVGDIVKIELTCTANRNAKYGPGSLTTAEGSYTYTGAVGTWIGSATEVVLSASNNQARATQIVVVLEEGATDVENVFAPERPVKIIKNGQMMIMRGEHVYNVLGAQLK